MTHSINANPLDYDAKYPQVAESANDEAKIEIMERNEGKEVMFQVDGIHYYGKIGNIPNSEHYCVVVNRNGTPWEWYVREESVHFVEDAIKDFWQNSEV
jgi:hypothetical protein